MTASLTEWAPGDHIPDPSLSPWRSSDSAIVRWIVEGSASVSRAQLLYAARERLVSLLTAETGGEDSISPRSAATLNAVLEAVVEDGQPTPQIFAAGDRAVTCEWLVGGSHLQVTAEEYGLLYWWSDQVTSLPPTELQCPASDERSEAMAVEFRNRLNLLSGRVARRHPVVTATRRPNRR